MEDMTLMEENIIPEGTFSRECEHLAKMVHAYRFEYVAGVATLLRALLRARTLAYLPDVLADVRAVVEQELRKKGG